MIFFNFIKKAKTHRSKIKWNLHLGLWFSTVGELSAIALLFYPQVFKRKIWKKWSKMRFALGLLNTLGRGCWIPVGPIPACQHPHFTRLWAFRVRPSQQIGWNFPLTPLSTASLVRSSKASVYTFPSATALN